MTNISKNAMLGNGEKLGKVDENIKKGIPVDEACKDILKAVYLKRYWVTLGSLYYQICPKIAALSENVTGAMGRYYYKKQMNTLEKAKKQN